MCDVGALGQAKDMTHAKTKRFKWLLGVKYLVRRVLLYEYHLDKILEKKSGSISYL